MAMTNPTITNATPRRACSLQDEITIPDQDNYDDTIQRCIASDCSRTDRHLRHRRQHQDARLTMTIVEGLFPANQLIEGRQIRGLNELRDFIDACIDATGNVAFDVPMDMRLMRKILPAPARRSTTSRSPAGRQVHTDASNSIAGLPR